MLGIILCDDDQFILKIMQEQIDQILSEHRIDSRIVCMSSNYKYVLSFLKKHPDNYLYFLDLDFGSNECNGIDIAKQIRTTAPASKIVFVTNHHGLAIDVLKSGAEPFGFIEKSTDIAKMRRSCYQYIYLALQSLSTQKEKRNQKIIRLKPGASEIIELPASDILYIEALKTKSHCICYHTINGSSITVRDTMEHAMEILGDDFIRSHRSIIVQISHIIGIEHDTLRLINGTGVPCSFRQRKKLKGVINGKEQ